MSLESILNAFAVAAYTDGERSMGTRSAGRASRRWKTAAC